MQPVPILAYHSIAELNNAQYDRWCVSPARFTQQMSVLADRNYTVLTTGQLVDHLTTHAQLPERCAVLTFDDGLQDFLTGAIPVLTRFGFPATLYVVAGLIGRTSRWLAALGEGSRPMLQGSDLRDLAASGIEIGGHSMTHPELDVLDKRTAFHEMQKSRLTLEDVIGSPVRSFAYPHGYASRSTRHLAREAGYSSAVRVRHALSEVRENPFGLSRLVITEDLDQDRFLALIEGQAVKVAPSQDRVIGDLWRLSRKLRRWRRQSLGWQPAPTSSS
jgi:peptidoglycan/xylan/chitin deacetylase (PgdA/CDA1 family)